MSTFRVGMRVKLVAPTQSCHVGFTGVIKALFAERHHVSGRLIDCDVDWDQRLQGLTVSYTHTSRLEPILPESMQPTTWDKCLWQPEGVAA